jgi:hypothetical protein
MPSNAPVTGPHEFRGYGHGVATEVMHANAAAFIAERVAGIEWQLVELNNNLFKILSVLQSPTGGP